MILQLKKLYWEIKKAHPDGKERVRSLSRADARELGGNPSRIALGKLLAAPDPPKDEKTCRVDWQGREPCMLVVHDQARLPCYPAQRGHEHDHSD
jgi:hypothetical protein